MPSIKILYINFHSTAGNELAMLGQHFPLTLRSSQFI